MLFSKQLPLTHVIDLCRALRHNLGAGVALVRVVRQQAERGPAGLRPFAARVSARLEQGDSLTDALAPEKDLLPPLLLAMVKVGEETGNLPEIFGELEKYYLLQQQLLRKLRSKSLLPIIQFVLALFLVAGLILVLGMIAASRNTAPISLFGLSGAGGALIFLAVSFGSIALGYVTWRLLKRWARQKAAVDALLLRVPVLGPCVEALVLARFALALRLTLESGMSISRALRLAMEATGNAAFTDKTAVVTKALKQGEPLLEALSRSGLFKEEFLQLIAVGEEGGRVPEVMRHQAAYYQEESERRLSALTRLATMLVWLVYAVFMIITIFRIASRYLGALGA